MEPRQATRIHGRPFSPGIARGDVPTVGDYGQQALSARVFQVDTVGHTALMVPVAVAHPDRFEITVEPVGGVAIPSGPVMLHGHP